MSETNGWGSIPDSEGFVFDGTTLVRYTGNDTEVVVPEGTECIGSDAFAQREFLARVTLPSTLRRISHSAFESCTRLTWICGSTDRLAIIDNRAFYHCTSLEEFVLPRDLRYIGTNAFRGCKRLILYPRYEEVPFSLSPIGVETALGGLILIARHDEPSVKKRCRSIACALKCFDTDISEKLCVAYTVGAFLRTVILRFGGFDSVEEIDTVMESGVFASDAEVTTTLIERKLGLSDTSGGLFL